MTSHDGRPEWANRVTAGERVRPPPIDKTREDLQHAMGQIESLQMDNKRGREEYRRLKQAYHELELEFTRFKDNNTSLQHELAAAHRQLDDSKALSETRGRELVGAQVFLTKADSLSISDIVEKVGVLNEEIFQTAASLGETLVHTARRASSRTMQDPYDRTYRAIGEPLMELLIDQRNHEVNEFVALVVGSVLLVNFCVSKLDSWCPDDMALDASLGTLYHEIRKSEEPTVAGRWRALTRSRTRTTTKNWTAEFVKKLDDVLMIAGWDWPPAISHRAAFEQKLVPIFKAVENLRIALGEKITSADIEVFVARTGSQFKPWMEDAYGDIQDPGGKWGSKEVVVGTTSMGLKKILTSRGYHDLETLEPVLAPKVILETTIREALQPSALTKGRNNSRQMRAHLDGK
ncbi:hypothetical protein GALMADRAFT_214905 [Galerina marginata CBS 339.88]|uniref:Uncharacterized protein n=1 Tax=Galerina marginata (strain CBS 339.88) TaxID=685588 RepID=A0A067SFZ9_GALM3|nr:hypothetical protein GALMADRAFT_214905 [Galerina marginata CBS 339.88]